MSFSSKTNNGVEIGYDKSGYDELGYVDSPAVVLLSGWAHDLSFYDCMFPHLESKYKVIRVNWRGHVPNQKYTADFGVEEQVTNTIELLKALNVKQFHLVSFTWWMAGTRNCWQTGQGPGPRIVYNRSDHDATPSGVCSWTGSHAGSRHQDRGARESL